MTNILKYDTARRAIAEAKTFDEVRDWEDKAAAVREYGRRARDRSMELDAIEIQLDARRRRGQLILAMKGTGELADGRKPSSADDGSFRKTLAEIDVTPNESARDQKIAMIDGDSYERLKERCRKHAESHPEKHSFDILRPPDQPINGARAVMGSRQEPDDSLDYFPTPPWATRALVEVVLPQMPDVHFGFADQVVWEPSSGEGHMSDVLREYAADVTASDIFDYGKQDYLVDFLKCEQFNRKDQDADWIITNPPFAEKTEDFVLHAIRLAKVGVAMFVRMQWLETNGRYEAVFRDSPPTLIAFFAERVNLCKGRWDPDGSTATAYVWLIWIKGKAPQAPFWIPPGQRAALTKPDDRARFAPQTIHLSEAQQSFVDESGMVRVSADHIIAAAFVTEQEWDDLLAGANTQTGELPSSQGGVP
jgi:hypothetical protein